MPAMYEVLLRLLFVLDVYTLQPFVQALSALLWLAMDNLAESWPYSVAPSKYRRKRKNASASPDAALRPGVGYGRGAGDPGATIFSRKPQVSGPRYAQAC